MERRHPLRAAISSFLFTVFVLAISTIPLSALFVLSQMSGNASFPAECALVFGSAILRGGEAGPGIERRIDAAAKLYREQKVKRLILTGGRGVGNTLSEAQVMRSSALQRWVAERDIRTEEASNSTWENIKFTQPHVRHCSSVVAVSDRTHLARIRLTALLQGVKLTTFPAQRAEPLIELRAIIRETLGILLYLFHPAAAL